VRRLLIGAGVALAIVAVAGAIALASGAGGGPAGRQTVAAPIDDVEVLVRESNPPQVTARITAGLPSGCAQRDSHSVRRSGDTITVSVLNSVPTGNAICTMIYGTYLVTLDLGTDFRRGATYTIQVNDRTKTFKT
jgi:hypothetical protein